MHTRASHTYTLTDAHDVSNSERNSVPSHVVNDVVPGTAIDWQCLLGPKDKPWTSVCSFHVSTSNTTATPVERPSWQGSYLPPTIVKSYLYGLFCGGLGACDESHKAGFQDCTLWRPFLPPRAQLNEMAHWGSCPLPWEECCLLPGGQGFPSWVQLRQFRCPTCALTVKGFCIKKHNRVLLDMADLVSDWILAHW